MICDYMDSCGGCSLRYLDKKDYQNTKCQKVLDILKNLQTSDFLFAEPIFVEDGHRRRASLAFSYQKRKLALGFNRRKSTEIIDIASCCLLSPKLNAVLPSLRALLNDLCSIKIPLLKKGRHVGNTNLNGGDLLVTEADNGIDVILEFNNDINLDYRMTIFDFIQNNNDIIRISHRHSTDDTSETLVEKAKPYINICGREVYIPAGTFLQASKASEQVLINTVIKYLGDSTGRIADLFCGVGTFSYPLASEIKNKIVAIDSSKPLLDGFRKSVNKNMIPNIEIIEKNLFKYPLDEKELAEFDVILFDPPRAGAEAQVKKFAATENSRLKKIIAVSCNPHSFVRDANILISAGYKLQEITLVDQFTYSNHSELVALFTKM